MMWNLYSWFIVEKLERLRAMLNSLLSGHLEEIVPVLPIVQVLFHGPDIVQTFTFLKIANQNGPLWITHYVCVMRKIDDRQSCRVIGNSLCFALSRARLEP